MGHTTSGNTNLRKGICRRALALTMALAMVLTSLNLPALAADADAAAQSAAALSASDTAELTPAPENTPEQTPEQTASPTEAAAATPAPEDTAAPTETPADTAAPAATPADTAAPTATATPAATASATPAPSATAAPVPFAQSTVVDGVVITVTADAGVFPADAVLRASRIEQAAELDTVTQAVSEAADKNRTAESDDSAIYAFDVSVCGADGQELEPDAAMGEVKVSFSNPDPEKWDAADFSLYHVEEATGEASRLDAQADESAQTVAAATPGLSPFALVIEPDEILLYSGYGVVSDPAWAPVRAYVYEAVGQPASFPTPSIQGSDVLKFAGWYTDAAYKNAASAPQPGNAYYAKWNNGTLEGSNGSVSYKYMGYGVDIKGIVNGTAISSTYRDYGFETRYVTDNANVTGGAGSYSGGLLGYSGPVVSLFFPKLYITDIVTLDGPYVTHSYYLWNYGTTDIDHFNLGVVGTMDVNRDSGTTSSLGADSGGSYVSLTSGGYESRLYYAGTGSPAVDSLYLGVPDSHRRNVFADQRTPGKGMDGVAFAWKDLSIPANSVVVRSITMGCGAGGTMSRSQTFSYDADGDGVLENKSTISSTYVTAPAKPSRPGYYFLGWNTAADGSGTVYQPGSVIPAVNTSVALYSQWRQIENTATVSVTLDGAAWGARSVQLYHNGALKYTLKETPTAGTYQNVKVVNGTYDIYIGGRKSDQTMTVASDDRNIEVKGAVAYKTVNVTTLLDGVPAARRARLRCAKTAMPCIPWPVRRVNILRFCRTARAITRSMSAASTRAL